MTVDYHPGVTASVTPFFTPETLDAAAAAATMRDPRLTDRILAARKLLDEGYSIARDAVLFVDDCRVPLTGAYAGCCTCETSWSGAVCDHEVAVKVLAIAAEVEARG
jgi:hypothetical protein